MFYEQLVLAKKGPLGTIWLAAHAYKKVARSQILSCHITEMVDQILNPKVLSPTYLLNVLGLSCSALVCPLTYRNTPRKLVIAECLIIQVYQGKVGLLYKDASDALVRMKGVMLFY